MMIVVCRGRWIAGECEPRTAGRHSLDRRNMRDVPENDVGVLNGLIVVVDSWHAAWRPRRARSGRTPRSPAFDWLVFERPDFGLIARPRPHGGAPAAGLVEHPPLVVGAGRVRGFEPAFLLDVVPAAAGVGALKRIAVGAADVQVESKRQMIGVPPFDLFAWPLNNDCRAELSVLVKSPDVVVLVIFAVEIVGDLEVEAEHDVADLDLASLRLQLVGEWARTIA